VANDRGTNRRFVVTNRPGAALLAGPTYDEYAARGESENRNKEFKCDLAMDRLSDHGFVANYFRLYLHAAAMNLLVRLRRFIAEPLPTADAHTEVTPRTDQSGEAALPAAATCRPVEALIGAEQQRYFRLRGMDPKPDPGATRALRGPRRKGRLGRGRWRSARECGSANDRREGRRKTTGARGLGNRYQRRLIRFNGPPLGRSSEDQRQLGVGE
jgi:hypothetical protein